MPGRRRQPRGRAAGTVAAMPPKGKRKVVEGEASLHELAREQQDMYSHGANLRKQNFEVDSFFLISGGSFWQWTPKNLKIFLSTKAVFTATFGVE